MNNRVTWNSPVKKNGWAANVVLVLVLVFFATVGIRDILNAF